MTDILRRADAIAGEDRARDYGHPRDNFRRIADLWEAYMRNRPDPEMPVEPEDVAAMMILMKIARQQHTPKDDNLLDIAGYVKCWDMLGEDPEPVDAPGPLEVQSLRTHDDGQETPDPGFWYLATPYRAYKGPRASAYGHAARQAALFSDAGIPVFSPIVHSHIIASHTERLVEESPEWVDLDMPMVRAARGVIVCMLPGWEVSAGIHRECSEAIKLGKRVIHMTPGQIPEGLK